MPRIKHHHDHSSVLRKTPEHLIGHVPPVAGQPLRPGVGEDHGRLGDIEDVVHGFRGRVGEVHQHPEAVHLPYHFLAELGQTPVLWVVGRGIGPVGIARMCEGHVPHPQVIEGPKRAERVLDGVAALHS